jgi:hypothetical protein
LLLLGAIKFVSCEMRPLPLEIASPLPLEAPTVDQPTGLVEAQAPPPSLVGAGVGATGASAPTCADAAEVRTIDELDEPSLVRTAGVDGTSVTASGIGAGAGAATAAASEAGAPSLEKSQPTDKLLRPAACQSAKRVLGGERSSIITSTAAAASSAAVVVAPAAMAAGVPAALTAGEPGIIPCSSRRDVSVVTEAAFTIEMNSFARAAAERSAVNLAMVAVAAPSRCCSCAFSSCSWRPRISWWRTARRSGERTASSNARTSASSASLWTSTASSCARTRACDF